MEDVAREAVTDASKPDHLNDAILDFLSDEDVTAELLGEVLTSLCRLIRTLLLWIDVDSECF